MTRFSMKSLENFQLLVNLTRSFELSIGQDIQIYVFKIILSTEQDEINWEGNCFQLINLLIWSI